MEWNTVQYDSYSKKTIHVGGKLAWVHFVTMMKNTNLEQQNLQTVSLGQEYMVGGPLLYQISAEDRRGICKQIKSTTGWKDELLMSLANKWLNLTLQRRGKSNAPTL